MFERALLEKRRSYALAFFTHTLNKKFTILQKFSSEKIQRAVEFINICDSSSAFLANDFLILRLLK